MSEKKNGISLISFIVILVLMVVFEGAYIIKLRNINENQEIASEDNTSEVVEVPNDFNDKMVNYIYSEISKYAENEYIYKKAENTDKKEVVSIQELNGKENDYKTIIKESIKDEKYFDKVNISGSEIKCKYNFIQLLDKLNLATDNNIGIGNIDNNGCKIYFYNNKYIDTSLLTFENTITNMGTDVNGFVKMLIEQLEEYANNGYIVMNADQEITDSKEYIASHKKEIRENIIKNLNNKEIFLSIECKDYVLKVKVNYNNLLSGLKMSSNSVTELEINENGVKEIDL